MTTSTDTEYALMAGHAYRTTRDEINWLPAPQGWTPYFPVPDPDTATAFPVTAGFEAISFQRGNEIVISYAGTYDKDISGDLVADAGLISGLGSKQLLQAAEYYLQVRAANPGDDISITLTGHSLGGGLAALVGVFFGVKAQTFDQAPFAKSAWYQAPRVMDYLAAKLDASGGRLYGEKALTSLGSYIAQKEVFGVPATYIPNSGLITNISVQGEFLSYAPSLYRIGTTIEKVGNTAPGVSGFELHGGTKDECYKKRSGLRPYLLGCRPIPLKKRHVQRSRCRFTVQTGVYGWAAI
jgi:Lipase (class 3)